MPYELDKKQEVRELLKRRNGACSLQVNPGIFDRDEEIRSLSSSALEGTHILFNLLQIICMIQRRLFTYVTSAIQLSQ